MVYKNKMVDLKIITAAKEEFLMYGYNKASLRNIANKAGITTGSLYTRYKSKDDLFESLIIRDFKELDKSLEAVNNLYYESRKEKDVNKFLDAIKWEQELYLETIFNHHDDCVLLMCKSEGSMIGKKTKKEINNRIKESIDFFKSVSKHEIDYDAIGFIMYQQVNFFISILEKNYDRKKTLSVIESLKPFVAAGWEKMFLQLMY